MYYIRFLKTPRLDTFKSTVRALITVTTDLGDDFYPGELEVYTTITTVDQGRDCSSSWHTIRWTAGMRSAWIEIHVTLLPSKLLRLFVATKQSLSPRELRLECMPEVLCVRSDTFGRRQTDASRWIERRWRTPHNGDVSIYEETGESIACHVW